MNDNQSDVPNPVDCLVVKGEQGYFVTIDNSYKLTKELSGKSEPIIFRGGLFDAISEMNRLNNIEREEN
jgi:hypothetical protein